ncbi:MAG: glycosyltransferase [Chloroflexota bacterium]
MKKSPRVTIGVPIYNGEKYMRQAFDSILNQTFTDFEVIIADNGSTDNTVAICLEYAAQDDRIIFHQNETNLGAAFNYNKVFHLARGEYFRWAAHDDYNEPTALELMVKTLDENPEAILSYPKTILIDENDDLIEYHEDYYDLRSDSASKRFAKFFKSSAWCHPVFGLIRTEVLGRTGLIGNFASSDRVLLGELAVQGKCYEIPEHLAFRRLHPENSTEANQTDEAMMNWYDPMKKAKLLTPRVVRMIAYAKGINRAPISFGEKIKSYGVLFRFYLSLDRLEGVQKELKQLFRAVPRIFSKA